DEIGRTQVEPGPAGPPSHLLLALEAELAVDRPGGDVGQQCPAVAEVQPAGLGVPVALSSPDPEQRLEAAAEPGLDHGRSLLRVGYGGAEATGDELAAAVPEPDSALQPDTGTGAVTDRFDVESGPAGEVVGRANERLADSAPTHRLAAG